ncbi:MAG TPA: MaoC family dehydratase N-terminal domain-containing protein [Dehalococcoidia bacterium]|nr:MaoC family dehydratase N-terminal domain-containing protein [Dehalococcoidia bacterium]
MTTPSLITDELRAQIGVEQETLLGEITLLDIQRYALTVGDLNPLYFDEAYAKQTPYGGIVAPPNYLTAVITWGVGPQEGELSRDGLGLRRNEQAEGNARRRMAGGQELEFHQPVRPGDVVRCLTRTESMEQREGRSGPFVLIITEQRYVNQRDELLVTCRQTAIMR